MTMQMQRAFNSRMLTKLTKYTLTTGMFDMNNIWVEGMSTGSNIWGVLKTGNQFSQLSKGEALQTEDGGERFSDFRTLFVTDKFPIEKGDKIGHKGKYYNVLQRSDESTYGFYAVLLERSEEWTPGVGFASYIHSKPLIVLYMLDEISGDIVEDSSQ